MQSIKAFFLQLVAQVQEWWNPADLLRTTPLDPWKLQYFYIGFLGLCLLLALALIFLPLHQNLKNRLYSLLWTNILIGVPLFAFRYQSLPILGMDLWRFVQEISTAVWAFSIFLYWRKQHPKVVLQEQVISYKSKYLPKAKK